MAYCCDECGEDVNSNFIVACEECGTFLCYECCKKDKDGDIICEDCLQNSRKI